jgi:hypothetical protein
MSEEKFLKVLIDYFAEYTGDNFDISLSREYMKFLYPMVSHLSVDEFEEMLYEFLYDDNHKRLWLGALDSLRIMDKDYLAQPELLLMYYLICKDKYILIDVLDGSVPTSDVDEIFVRFGICADDYRV